jgi:hypothetical protein
VCELTVSIEGIEGLAACCASIGFAVEDSKLEFLSRGLRISSANWAFNHLDPFFNTWYLNLNFSLLIIKFKQNIFHFSN